MRASFIVGACLVLGCGPRGGSGADGGGSGSASGSGGDEASTGGDGVELPAGCGDGVVDPEQFCFEPVLIPGLAEPHFVTGLDLDEDGRDELVVGYTGNIPGDYPCEQPNGGGYCMAVFRYEEAANEFVHRQTFYTNGLSGQLFHTDVDGDGTEDFILTSQAVGFLAFRNVGGKLTGPEGFGFEGARGFGRVTPVDSDGDGNVEYLVPYKDPGPHEWADHVQLRRKVGDDSVKLGPKVPLPDCWLTDFAAVGDLTGDGLDDAVLLTSSLPYMCDAVEDAGELDIAKLRVAVVVFANPDTGLMEAGPHLPTGGTAERVWLADVNDDGHLDLVFRLAEAEDAIILNRGDGTFQDVQVFGRAPKGQNPERFVGAVDDFNGSGSIEFLGDGGYLLDPLGTRKIIQEPDPFRGAWFAGDVNGDGIHDLYRRGETDASGHDLVYVLISRP